MEDILGQANLSIVERLSTLWGGKCMSTIGKSLFGVLCRQVVYMVFFSRLIEVPL